jgi:hypothetical protein
VSNELEILVECRSLLGPEVSERTVGPFPGHMFESSNFFYQYRVGCLKKQDSFGKFVCPWAGEIVLSGSCILLCNL